MSSRLEARFAALRQQKRAGLITFLVAGDPDMATFEALLAGLAGAGADVIEIGMPFSDPMADGPTIQAGYLRALRSGTKLRHILPAVRRFRERDTTTPIVLMGYYNPIWNYGPSAFLDDAKAAGVDGLIVVDLPPEEDDELCLPARARGLHWIRLATPTTDDARLPKVLAHTSGFLYYVSVTGITGAKTPVAQQVAEATARIRKHTDLPIAVGFGIREPEQAAEIARYADAVVVGSALVDLVARHLDAAGRPLPELVSAVHGHVRALAGAIAGVTR